jgi:hypothetical protein
MSNYYYRRKFSLLDMETKGRIFYKDAEISDEDAVKIINAKDTRIAELDLLVQASSSEMYKKKFRAMEKAYDDLFHKKDIAYELDVRDKRIADLKAVLKLVHKDLLERAEEDSDGCKVVNLGSSVWLQLKKILKIGE